MHVCMKFLKALDCQNVKNAKTSLKISNNKTIIIYHIIWNFPVFGTNVRVQQNVLVVALEYRYLLYIQDNSYIKNNCP